MTDEAKALVEPDKIELAHIIHRAGHVLTAAEVEALADLMQLIETQAREIERLREANGILEDGLQEVGDDYPGSSCQEWCQHQIKQARAALAGDSLHNSKGEEYND